MKQKLNILYVRCSSLITQSTDRQRVNEQQYSLVVEDKISGTVPFFDRPGGKKILQLVEKGMVSDVSAWEIDRLGRDVRNILDVIHYFTEKGICVHFISQGLRTIEASGKQNAISRLVISILGVIAEMERSQIKERQREGILLAKAKGAYKGRKTGTGETVLKFLSKPDNAKALAYLKKGLTMTEVSKLVGIHINTVSKVRKLGLTTKVA